MIQKETYLKVIDNSGARFISCIYIGKGLHRRYAFIGDLVLGSVKKLRQKRRATVKIQKGELSLVLLVRSQVYRTSFMGDRIKFFENAGVLLTKQHKALGTRIFGALPRFFRYTRFLKLVFISAGIIK